MGFFCEHCDAEIDAPYEWGGMLIGCPGCSGLTTLRYKSGQSIALSSSGYSLPFRDFVGLMTQEGWREQAHPLVERLLECSIERGQNSFGSTFVLRARSGALIPYEVAHLRIQADADAQRRLYNLAMNLWR